MNLDVLLINGGQIRRGWLIAVLEQTDLARTVGVGLSTIQSFEARRIAARNNEIDTPLRVLDVLKASGASFSSAGGISLGLKPIDLTKQAASVA
jgi:hypothetical protein